MNVPLILSELFLVVMLMYIFIDKTKKDEIYESIGKLRITEIRNMPKQCFLSEFVISRNVNGVHEIENEDEKALQDQFSPGKNASKYTMEIPYRQLDDACAACKFKGTLCDNLRILDDKKKNRTKEYCMNLETMKSGLENLQYDRMTKNLKIGYVLTIVYIVLLIIATPLITLNELYFYPVLILHIATMISYFVYSYASTGAKIFYPLISLAFFIVAIV